MFKQLSFSPLTIFCIIILSCVACSEEYSSNDNASKSTSVRNYLDMEFVEIPAGSFLMGSLPNQAGHEPDEVQHLVTITKPFFLQTTEVTRRQWLALIDGSPSSFPECGLDCPVDRLRYEWIQFYIAKLNEQDPTYRYRLPTEAEWEYAARAGSTSNFYTGACITDSDANLSGQQSLADCKSFPTSLGPTPVKSLPPNKWGLYDLYGNSWEMVEDWYGEYRSEPTMDPQGPAEGEFKVLRGGSWRFYPTHARSANRFKSIRDIAGFRLVLETK
ncbi:formylglycine-generating enzyme family protein [Aurantivibrio plasticivorans]